MKNPRNSHIFVASSSLTCTNIWLIKSRRKESSFDCPPSKEADAFHSRFCPYSRSGRKLKNLKEKWAGLLFS
ncbi:unnamed protein product [Callosobruchus maculatus]|uniref:Uncharacterized protein n=1 Tax=Callosobruchus maculatus TaxID=64391 RepID=A0A653C6N4_CALMS|nr:unnamed protein product [Callosobruchus maculatus]